MKKLAFSFMFIVIFVAIPAIAQTPIDDSPALPGGILGQLVAWLLSASGIVLIAQLIKGFGLKIPTVVKPMIGPVFGIIAGLISQYWGVVVDFGPIQGALLGTTATFLFDAAKTFLFDAAKKTYVIKS